MQSYVIATCKPARTLEVAGRLREMAGEEAVVAPSYRQTIRVGRNRVRTEVERPVLGGLVFVATDAVESAREGGGICSCRGKAAATGGAVPMLRHDVDADGIRRHAVVGEDELQGLLDYAAERNAAFDGRAEPPTDSPLASGLAVGQRVRLLGVLTGMTGVVVSARNGDVVVDLDKGQAVLGGSGARSGVEGMFGGSVTVPVAMCVAEGAEG